jgi:protein bicaudal C
VKEATLLLMDHMCHNMAHSTPVIMTMEISPQHHAIVIGKVKSLPGFSLCFHRALISVADP